MGARWFQRTGAAVRAVFPQLPYGSCSPVHPASSSGSPSHCPAVCCNRVLLVSAVTGRGPPRRSIASGPCSPLSLSSFV